MAAEATDLPDDDGTRELTLADPNDDALTHLAVVGDTYTVLVRSEDTAGRYTLIDMEIPAGGGPPPHRHDFEEMFHVLRGEVEVTLRSTTSRAKVGETVDVPANVPHAFRNPTDGAIRLCVSPPPTEGSPEAEGVEALDALDAFVGRWLTATRSGTSA